VRCPICWDSSTDTEWTTTACHHLFHTSCLARWLAPEGDHRTCPVCRFSLRPAPQPEARATDMDLLGQVNMDTAGTSPEDDTVDLQLALEASLRVGPLTVSATAGVLEPPPAYNVPHTSAPLSAYHGPPSGEWAPSPPRFRSRSRSRSRSHSRSRSRSHSRPRSRSGSRPRPRARSRSRSRSDSGHGLSQLGRPPPPRLRRSGRRSRPPVPFWVLHAAPPTPLSPQAPSLGFVAATAPTSGSPPAQAAARGRHL
jgi:hypothetical protein